MRAWLAILIVIFQSLPMAAQQMLMVNRKEVRIREDATVQSRRVAIMQQGQELEQIKRHNEWLQVRLPDDRIGWVHSALVRQRWIIEGKGVRVRSGPASDQTAITMVYRGQEVGRMGSSGNWLEVVLEDGQSGWIQKRFARQKTKADASDVLPAEDRNSADDRSISPSVPQESVPESVEEDTDLEPFVDGEREAGRMVRRNPYATGLQFEAAGDYAAALEQFEEVLRKTPDHVRALFHAAKAHKHLGDYDKALDILYSALEKSGGRKDLFLTLGEVYRLRGQQDSVRKYRALFRGEDWLPVENAEVDAAVELLDDGFGEIASQTIMDTAGVSGSGEEKGAQGPGSGIPWLLLAAAVFGTFALVAIVGLVYVRRNRVSREIAGESDSGDQSPTSKFGRVMESEGKQASQRQTTLGEEAELDQQIEDKWQELRASAQGMVATPGSGPESGAEDGYLDHILDHLEALRKALDAQDDRARTYADLVRMQNMKIDAMTEEIKLLRRRPRRDG